MFLIAESECLFQSVLFYLRTQADKLPGILNTLNPHFGQS